MNHSFRTDINALRALAVVAVVLFHFKIPGFGGGFVGVDVFFVVSGFLMTQIICSRLANNQFSLVGFYASRIRRIAPALLVLCMALLAFGFVYLPLDDYRDAIKVIKSSLLFRPIFHFWTRVTTSTLPCRPTGCFTPGRCRSSGSFICCIPYC